MEIKKHKYREPFAMDSIPSEVLFKESRRRYRILREQSGPWATNKKFRFCKGCKQEYSARQMRMHKCSISYKKR